ncbi:MAG: protease HtpX [Phototrophicales bacterium]|nr:MAG: protease HtpX [Phototrophicales bacterium]
MGPRLKTFVLLALLTALVLFVGQLVGGYTGLVIAGIFVVLMNFGSLYWSDKIVLKMYRARPADKSSKLYRTVERLARRAKLPVPKVYVLPSQQPNAFATGRSPKHAAVAATEGLLAMMNQDELDGVIAHELSHIKHYDTLITTVAATFAGIISYVATMAQWAALFGGFRGNDEDGQNIVGLLFLIIITPIVATLLQLALSRAREFLADEGAARITHNPGALASALAKLDQATLHIPMKEGTPATSSLFIANPFRRGTLVSLFSTHPPIEQRIARLRRMKP